MQKHVNLVDLVKSFPTNIYLQNLASIQKRTNPIKFAHLAEKSEKGSISNLSTKVLPVARKPGLPEDLGAEATVLAEDGEPDQAGVPLEGHRQRARPEELRLREHLCFFTPS